MISSSYHCSSWYYQPQVEVLNEDRRESKWCCGVARPGSPIAVNLKVALKFLWSSIHRWCSLRKRIHLWNRSVKVLSVWITSSLNCSNRFCDDHRLALHRCSGSHLLDYLDDSHRLIPQSAYGRSGLRARVTLLLSNAYGSHFAYQILTKFWRINLLKTKFSQNF